MEEEYLTSELKKLVGWGAHPRRLPYLPTLRQLAGVDEEARIIDQGFAILRYLKEQIDSLPAISFRGKTYEPDKVHRIFRLLLQIEGSDLKAPARRSRVIMLLGLYFTPDVFRQPYGPERELVNILAVHMLKASGLQTGEGLAA